MEFKTDVLLHGGDYNPDQWLDRPDILERDAEMLAESGCNVVSLGIFAWSTLEPEEGVFRLDWMEQVIDRLYAKGIRVILATPSGARPKWLADKYPEVLRVDKARRRQLFGVRHNHCYTSPVYREKVRIINQKLAERFGNHPAVIMWHISNEYGGECHCPLCQAAFRDWLKEKYQTIGNLNSRWCTTFWSHTYQSFDDIESPSEIGETQLHALNLDWKRFVTHQTRDFMRWEIKAVRDAGSSLPVTANLMYYFDGLDYFKMAKDIDVVSWDTYPTWGKKEDIAIARDNARKAGVEDVVRFEVADMRNFRREDTYRQLVTNPPYGERLLERQEAEALYRDFGHMWERLPDAWRTLVLSSHMVFERTFGHQAKKNLKLYNGMIKCDLFMYGNV